MPRMWLFDLLTRGEDGLNCRHSPLTISAWEETMTKPRQEARRQLEQFLSTLFLPDEWIELRFIESWVSRGKKQSRVVRAAEWMRREEFVSQYREITDFAEQERANVYFGVCPRSKRGDSQDDQVHTVRCLWCDIDAVTAKEALQRWKEASVPQPSIVVGSGSGIHAYWLLERDIRSRWERTLIAAMLPLFYRSFGGDHVQNLSRLMRPPETVNCKNARNGLPPRPCTLISCQPDVRYPLETFARWIAMAKRKQSLPSTGLVSARSPTDGSSEKGFARKEEAAEIVRNLDRPSRDRSRRDFAVVCDLLRLGLTGEEIWPLVAGCSKFESNGRPYFELTIANAEKRIPLDTPTASRPRAAT